MSQIQALTLIRPWAWAIAHAGKDIENRSWRPSLSVGDLIAIHAGQAWDPGAALWIQRSLNIQVPPRGNHPAGVIVAVATFACVTHQSDSVWFTGPIGWRLTEVTALAKPVPCTGAQGLWPVPPGIDTPVLSQYHKLRGSKR